MAEDNEKNSGEEIPENGDPQALQQNAPRAGYSDSMKETDASIRPRSITSFFSAGTDKESGNFLRTLLRTMLRGGLGHLIILAFLLMVFFAFIVAVREVLLPFILAVVIAYILSPVVNRLHEIKLGRLNMPRWTAVILIYVTGALIIYLFKIGRAHV